MTRPHLPIPHLPQPRQHHSHSTSPSDKSYVPTGRGGAGNMRNCNHVDRAAEQESTETRAAVQDHMANEGYLCPPHQQPEDQQALRRIHTEQLLARVRSERNVGDAASRRGSAQSPGTGELSGKGRQRSLVELKELLNPHNAGRRRKVSLIGSLRRVVSRKDSDGGASNSEDVDGDGDGLEMASSSSRTQSTVESKIGD